MLVIFLDIETTGLDPVRNHVIDIGFKIVDHTTGELKTTYQSIICPTKEQWATHDPQSLVINGYSWESVSVGITAAEAAAEITALFQSHGIVRGKAVFICQNPAFDRVFFSQLIGIQQQEQMQWPYHWLDLASMYWALTVKRTMEDHQLFPEKIILSKNEIAKHYGLATEPHPHRAINGVNHLITCYEAVLGCTLSAAG